MLKTLSSIAAIVGSLLVSVVAGGTALAQSAPIQGAPAPGQIGLQESATEMGRQIAEMFNIGLTPVMVIIALFVTALLIYVMIRYNERVNPTPSDVTHNTTLEIIWIAIPTVIVLVLLVFAWKLIFFIDTQPQRPGLVINAIGKQWRWEYAYQRYMPADDYAQVAKAIETGFEGDLTAIGEYVDLDGFNYDSCSRKVCGEATDVIALGEGLSLAEVDNHMVIPSGTDIAFLIDAADVGHSFAMPSFGIKIDAWPGRTNFTWAHVEAGREGIYIGQCSEICGYGHSYMPIVIEVVTPAQFDAWVQEASDVVISSGGTKAPPRVSDVLGDNYWETQTAMVGQ